MSQSHARTPTRVSTAFRKHVLDALLQHLWAAADKDVWVNAHAAQLPHTVLCWLALLLAIAQHRHKADVDVHDVLAANSKLEL